MTKKREKMRILVMHGPNLNLLGVREPDVYGKETLQDINGKIEDKAKELGVSVRTVQSNSEADMIEEIHASRSTMDGLVLNPAAFTHTSVAIRDAILATGIPFVEVHLSNIAAREPFRQRSFFTDIALGIVSGFGARGYLYALEGLVSRLEKASGQTSRQGP